MIKTTNFTAYYVTDYGDNKIHIFDDDWGYIRNKTYNGPIYMIAINSILYITSDILICKTDSNLNLLGQYSLFANGYMQFGGIYYNNSLIFVVSRWINEIIVFDLDLKRKYFILTLTRNSLWSIYGYSDQLYVGNNVGNVLIIANKTIINSFSACNRNTSNVHSISIDSFGYVATSCAGSQSIFLYFQNGSLAKTGFSNLTDVYFIGYDSKNHLVLILGKEIRIYS